MSSDPGATPPNRSTAGARGAPTRLGWRLCWGMLCLGLALVGTSCGTFSSREVQDPGAAVARLRAGGSVQAEVDRLAEPIVARGDIRGMAVGILTPDGHTQVLGYGSTGASSPAQRPAGDTIFQIGSVSKLFIATLLATLVEEGVLHYDDTVRRILPAEVRLSDEAANVTLYELATNTGGFPRQPFCPKQLRDFLAYLFTGRNVYAYITRPFLYEYLAKHPPKPKEEREYVYSNIGYGLLAHLMEVRTGRSFPDLLEEKVCRPLGLRDTTFTLNADQHARLATGHVGDQPRFVRRGRAMPPWDMGEIMRASGCLYSTADDLLRFARLTLGKEGHPLEAALASTHEARLTRPVEDVGFGWLIDYAGENRLAIHYKHGMVSGYHGYIGLNPRTSIAVVVLCNTFSWEDRIGHNLVLRLTEGLTSDPQAQEAHE